MQPENAPTPISVIPSGMRTVASAEQFLKRPSFMTVTPSGMYISVKSVQLSNADLPIEVSRSRLRSIAVSALQFMKARSPMVLIFEGSVTLTRLVQPE